MASSGSKAEFDEELFETRLEGLKDTQEGIQQMSAWCLQQRMHHKKIVVCWLNVFKRVRVDHRLVLFYLANDVIQYSKRKRFEFVEGWATALQRATTMVRDERVKSKIQRIFSIWEQREIYSEEYLSDLNGLLNINPPKKSQPTTESSYDFQSANLITNVRECVALSVVTDNSFKKLPRTPNCDIATIKQQLKDKTHSDDIEREIDRYITYMEAYNKNLQAEIKSRKAVLSNMDTAIKFYSNQRGEVKVVVSAYKSFGNRIKNVKKKLEEVTPSLPSPIPSPDIDAPSPEPDADNLQLPDDSPISMNLFKNNINGYSSYLDGKLPFDINDFKRDEAAPKTTSQQAIEVIGSRSDDESFNSSTEYYKPEPIGASYSSPVVNIPGLNSINPVPPVASEYTSLARSTHYSAVHENAANPAFARNNGPLSSSYSSLVSNYSSNDFHHSTNNSSNSANGLVTNVSHIMPPPPLPQLNNSSSEDFNSTWNMSMSWTSGLDSSTASVTSYAPNSADTPVSPTRYEAETHSASVPSTLEFSDTGSSLLTSSASQDVDHRQLPPAFSMAAKLGLGKEKNRLLDIDHRNLISLTGSPTPIDGNNASSNPHSWMSSSSSKEDNDANTGDVDYRTLACIKPAEASNTSAIGESNLFTRASTGKKSNSPLKSNASSSSDSQKDDGATRYDPTDMVVDMDMSMSDEDLDDLLREVNEQNDDEKVAIPTAFAQLATTTGAAHPHTLPVALAPAPPPPPRPPLLETPSEYIPPNIWDTSATAAMAAHMNNYSTSAHNMSMEAAGQHYHEQQPEMGDWNWNNGDNMRGGMPPMPPRPPFSPYQQRGGGNGGGRGRGRGGWSHSPQNSPYRQPFFPRGGPGGGRGGPGMRGGGYRGKFRGNSQWL